MNKWYQQLLIEIWSSGNKIFLYDHYGLMQDMNLRSDLSKEYLIHEYKSDADLNLFFYGNPSNNIIVFSKDDIQRDFISNNFNQFEIDLLSVFPNLDINLLKDIDVSYYQQIYDYNNELKSQGKSMDTEQLILKSLWDIDLGELYSLTNNLKVALSFLIGDKEIPESILGIVSDKLNINIFKLKENKSELYNWLKNLIESYIKELTESNIHSFDFSNNLIQFYLSKLDDTLKIDPNLITMELIKKEPWLANFNKDIPKDLMKNKIISDIKYLISTVSRLSKDEFDLNKIDDLIHLSKKFCHIIYSIQINDWSLEDFLDLNFCYQNLDQLFRKLLRENKFESLFRYPYNKQPYTVNKILDYINYNFKNEKIALIVFDGMAYDEWFILKNKLENFIIEETGVFAILPTITSFSRTAIFSGKTPREFMQDNKVPYNAEIDGFYKFLKDIDYAEDEILYGRINLNNNVVKTKNDEIPFDYLNGYGFLGLICNLFDDMSHNMVVYGELKSNLYNNIISGIESSQLIPLLEKLKRFGYKIIITSDHGNIFCNSNSIKSNKNLEFEKRKSSRCLIFDNEIFADKLVSENSDKCFKYSYNILPHDLYLVFASSNGFFSNRNDYAITHGGIMPEEWIVPLVVLK